MTSGKTFLLASALVACGLAALPAAARAGDRPTDRGVDPVAGLLSSGRYPLRDTPLDAGAKPVPAPRRGRVAEVDAPGELSQPDTEYRLTRDIVADGTAFTIKASQVTLNLNGHQVVYLNKPSPAATPGIAIPGFNRNDVAIVNGRIVQGAGGDAPSEGCHPVYDFDASNVEIAGLEIEYRTPETSGIQLHWVSSAKVHHNTVRDRGRVVKNRHQGVAAIEANRGGKGRNHAILHNRIEGARHIGIRAGAASDVGYNEVGIDSTVTNSTGIAAEGSIHHNRVLGGGVHPIGIWPGSDVKVEANYVEVQNTARGEEYGDTGASCLRMTWGNDNVEVAGNTFILHAEENYRGTGVKSWGRALWVGLPKAEQRALFRDNLIVATNRDGKTKAAAVAVVCFNESPGLVFRDNVIVSNWSNILLADNYGHAGGFPRFVGNRIIRQGADAAYLTIRSQYPWQPSTAVLIDNRFENGASLESVDLEFDAPSLKELAIGWRLTVLVSDQNGQPLPGASVTVTDRTGSSVFAGETDERGEASSELIAKVLTNRPEGRPGESAPRARPDKGPFIAVKTPHTIRVTAGGRIATQDVSLDASRRVEIALPRP